MEALLGLSQRLIENIERVIVGKREVIELLVIGLLSNGHILIRDVPGVGKTMMARALARSIDGEFRRIQFTPDLLPSDVTGVSVYNQKTQEFEVKLGPTFANIVLADEINRTTPRTQSGLLECMQESQVTIDGVAYPLPKPFLVIATENPIEYHGTYPLPEAQLDRFLMKINIGYPSKSQEKEIIAHRMKGDPIDSLQPVLGSSDVLALQEAITNVHIADEVMSYLIEVVTRTRESSKVKLGVSPRGSLAMMQACRVRAFMEERDYLTPGDVKRLAIPVLAHRIILQPDSIVKGLKQEDAILQILETIPVPVGE